jgi:hypothetical protein
MNYSSNSLVSNETGQKIELFLSARNLMDMDTFSKSDPYVKVFLKRNYNAKNF